MVKTIPTLCGSIASQPSALEAAMHNAAYAATGIPFTYVAFETENTEEAVAAMRSLGIRGLGVSMPHKIRIMKYLDSVDDTAKRIGAVNTVVNNDGYLTGYNTDWIGAVRALKEKIDIAGKRSVVVGAGGAARAIVYGLLKEQSHVTVYNRTISNGEKLAKEFDISFGGNIENLNVIKDYDILINATSVGFNDVKNSIIPAAILLKDKTVLDVVFIPAQSKFIRDALSKDCIVISGIRMLVHQALYQFELYTGQQAPFEVMEKALTNGINKL
ncbi:MAG: shikimate dehydrogenase [Ignavibacteriaceae bacterium]|jgi:shikimate dehydrogenase